MAISRMFAWTRRSNFAEYGSKIFEYNLPTDGIVQYAHWLHPAMGTSPPPLQQSDVDALREYISPGDLVIDVGAHGGDTTLPMALAADREGCTLALEPNRYVHAVLAKNAELNPTKTHIVPLCYAATPHDGPLIFNYGDASFCNGGDQAKLWWRFYRPRYSLPVEGRDLARLLENEYADWLPKLSFVKVDAEGADLAILRTLLPIIQRTRPVIRAEVFAKLSGKRRRLMYDFFISAGYDIFRYQEKAVLKGSLLERSDVARCKQLDVLAIPRVTAARSAA